MPKCEHYIEISWISRKDRNKQYLYKIAKGNDDYILKNSIAITFDVAVEERSTYKGII